MKYIITVFAITVLLLVGCEYESPLTKEHSLAIDSAVVGLWEPKPDEGEEREQDERMIILKYSDTEYLIHYPTGEGGKYYRGYPIKIGGISCVQLQIIGTDDGPPEEDNKGLFLVVSYQLTDDQLEIKTLNTDLVDCNLETTDELRNAFLKHKNNINLFETERVFRRMKKPANEPETGDSL